MWPLICERRVMQGCAVQRLCENTLAELLTKSCALRRRKAAAIELFKLL